MTDPDRIADLLGRYYADAPAPTTEELLAEGVTATDLAEVFALVELDRDVQRAAIVASAQELALAMTIALNQRHDK